MGPRRLGLPPWRARYQTRKQTAGREASQLQVTLKIIFFLFISIILAQFLGLRRLQKLVGGLTAVAHDVWKNLSPWAHGGWACRRGARRIGLNRRGPRWLAAPPVGPGRWPKRRGSRRLDLQPLWPMAVAVGYGGWCLSYLDLSVNPNARIHVRQDQVTHMHRLSEYQNTV
jgi:hypothetical protein